MNLEKTMILIDQTDKTYEISSCTVNKQKGLWEVTFNNGGKYNYRYTRLKWINDPKLVEINDTKYFYNGGELKGVQKILDFGEHSRIFFENGRVKTYEKYLLEANTNALSNKSAIAVFEYLKRIAVQVGLKDEKNGNLLSKQYEKIGFLSDRTALAVFLNPDKFTSKTFENDTLIFPFGCNSSQKQAVKMAMSNQVSIIQGPPGTGKTQTILNIISNILMQKKTVLVVSNNNSATENVFQKLSSPESGLGFLAAPLGKSTNKKKFIANQTGIVPNIAGWELEIGTSIAELNRIESLRAQIDELFWNKEQLAISQRELSAIELEKDYFDRYIKENGLETDCIVKLGNIKSKRFMQYLQECQFYIEKDMTFSFFFKIRGILFYGIPNWSFYKFDREKIYSFLQKLYYNVKAKELKENIQNFGENLRQLDDSRLIKDFTESSMRILRGQIFRKYGGKEQRSIFTEEDLWRNSHLVNFEYPIILSTTHSSKSSLGKDSIYDYIIMDEASQVDVATGALALSCAKNVVVVGDLKQLSNVITEDDRKKVNEVFEQFSLSEGYNYAENSFLQSVCTLIKNAPQTLLREHYRCHPKIIEFCNQKFYNNELIVMTENHDEADVLKVYKTPPGSHTRDRMNQRQVDIIRESILPEIGKENLNGIGIVTPYKDQVKTINKDTSLSSIETATVHKYQGREKDDIILSTVDDIISDFVDDKDMLNVAVSRAKNRLRVVISDKEENKNTNLADLISYIEYNNFEVVESDIYSVFDYLYKEYSNERLEFLKKNHRISEFDSENLMFALITKVLNQNEFSHLDVVAHYPLKKVIYNLEKLNDEEITYAMNGLTHLDFLIYNKLNKMPVLAIEVDGFKYHKEGTKQFERDRMKDAILQRYQVPLLRFKTNESQEEKRLIETLSDIVKVKFS